jgi:hypothetical protein
MQKRKWLGFKILLVMILGFLFSTGLMLMDYGATFKDTEAYGQSLVFERIEPRTIYHTGMLLVIGSFFVLSMLCAWELSKY